MISSFWVVTQRMSVVVQRRFGLTYQSHLQGVKQSKTNAGRQITKGRKASRHPPVCLAVPAFDSVVGLSNRRPILQMGTALTLTKQNRRKRYYIHRMLWAVKGSQGQQASQSGCSMRKKIR
jgi:hypothetical protein